MSANAQNYDYRAAAKPSILSDAGWENAPHAVSMKIAPPAGRFNIRGSDAFFDGVARQVHLSKPKKMLNVWGSVQHGVLW
ncbi:MAG: hypothetical protein ORN98_08055, partial [Alphaproteobacteria bacterium]|nr:hypothetical protein [Alphaproteobacteria bacterium]